MEKNSAAAQSGSSSSQFVKIPNQQQLYIEATWEMTHGNSKSEIPKFLRVTIARATAPFWTHPMSLVVLEPVFFLIEPPQLTILPGFIQTFLLLLRLLLRLTSEFRKVQVDQKSFFRRCSYNDFLLLLWRGEGRGLMRRGRGGSRRRTGCRRGGLLGGVVTWGDEDGWCYILRDLPA